MSILSLSPVYLISVYLKAHQLIFQDLEEATNEYRSNLAGVKKRINTSRIKIIKVKVEKLTSDTHKEKKFQEIKQFTIKEETHVVKGKEKQTSDENQNNVTKETKGGLGSFINDVTQIRAFSDHPPPFVTLK